MYATHCSPGSQNFKGATLLAYAIPTASINIFQEVVMYICGKQAL